MAVAVQMPREKKDPLTAIMQGLSIARDVYGIKTDMDKAEMLAKSAEAQAAEQASMKQEKELTARGRITPQEATELASKGMTLSDKPTPGAVERFLLKDGKEAPVFVSKPPPQQQQMSPYQREMLEFQKRRALLAETKDEKAAKKIVEEGARKLADTVEKTGVGEVYSSLKKLDSLIGGIDSDQDIPGVGPADQLSYSREARDTRIALSGLRNVILKARSGGAVTPEEAERLLEELGTGTFRTDEDLRTGLRNLRDTIRTKLALAESTAPEESLAIYRGRKGAITSDDPVFGGAGEVLEAGNDFLATDLEKELQKRQGGATAGF